MYAQFTIRARKVMQLANHEAQRQHSYIGTEHILFGLATVGSGVAVNVLGNLGVGPHKIRLEVDRFIQRGSLVGDLSNLSHTPRAKNVIRYALEEAHTFNHNCVGTEHLLLGLLRERTGVAARVLVELGLRLDAVRAEIGNVLAQSHDWERQEYSALPPLQPIEERTRRAVETPATCPKCGDPHVVRILWHPFLLSIQDLEDFHSGKAILGSLAEMEGPPWVCLHCCPRWSEVHQLSMQDYELQLNKEKAVATTDFDAAVRHRDAQHDLRQRQAQLIGELLKNP